MSFGKNLRGAIVCLACWGLVAPQGLTVAQEKRSTQQAQLSDVELAKGGVLFGTVVDGQGKPVAKATVMLKFAGATVARTESSKNGKFAIKGLRGGLHRLMAGTSSQTVRLWADGAAPTAAKRNVTSVTGSVVRGQYAPPMGGYVDPGYAPPMDQGYMPMDQGYVDPGYCPPAGGDMGYCPPAAAAATGGGFGMLDVITLATVGTSAAALVYALDNNDKLDDLEDALASP
ncbi:MAG: carboxypeptidase-like regulatory domain-containing protein [Planctomycetaceae bacterium]